MKNFTLIQWIIIVILSLLTALEPLSIDLYLPGFLLMSDAFNVPVSSVQISLTTFLGGFAIGQLLWGPLADRYGRKKPILISLSIFTIASIVCIYVRTIEELWVVRFIQAIGGCGGIVISRAIVTDYFHSTQTLKIFSLLALIMGIAPIVAPIIGNGVLAAFNWKALFGVMALLGVFLFLLTFFFLPETHQNRTKSNMKNIFRDYLSILKVRKFVVYSVLAGMANGVLMIYVANGPFLIMEKGGLIPNLFSVVFATNAFGLMIGSYLTNFMQKFLPVNKLVKLATFFMLVMSVILLLLMWADISIYFILLALFFFIFPIGILFPTTTELAITPFTQTSGSASALFGSIQLLLSFICSLISNYISNGTIVMIGISFFFCSLLSSFIIFFKQKASQNIEEAIIS